MIKKLIAYLAGKRDPIEIKLDRIDSVLLKPIGDAIGDAIAHTAHLKQLKEANPKLKIGVIVTNRNRDIFAYSGLVDELIEDTFSSYLKEHKKWGLYLDFQPTFTSKSIIQDKILSPNIIVVFNKKHKKQYNFETVKNYNYACPQSEISHISDYLNNSVLAQELSPESAIYELQKPELNHDYDLLWQDKIRILLSPFGSTREIPSQEIIELFTNLDKEQCERIKIVLTNTRNSQIYFSELKRSIKDLDIVVSPSTTIIEYLGLVDSADIIISVDSGTVHIATALKKKVLAFYARNMPNFYRWKPKCAPNVPYKAILSKTEGESNNDTFDFPMKEAAEWINQQLKNM